jgi:hypothetical protein
MLFSAQQSLNSNPKSANNEMYFLKDKGGKCKALSLAQHIFLAVG